MNHNKIILVTGGNRGIGLEICKQLAEQDHKVILTARDAERAKIALKKLQDTVQFLILDVTQPESFKKVKIFIQEKYERLDVLINNAGIISSSKGVDKVGMDEIRALMETNLFGPIQLTQSLLPLLEKSPDGRIINISSGMGALHEVGGGYAAYRLSKTALNSFSAILARDLAGTNIKVNSMCPGWVRTDMGGPSASRSVERGADTAVWLATADDIPNGKFLRDLRVIEW